MIIDKLKCSHCKNICDSKKSQVWGDLIACSDKCLYIIQDWVQEFDISFILKEKFSYEKSR